MNKIITGTHIVNDYKKCRGDILKMVTDNNMLAINQINASLAAFLSDESNQVTIDWSADGKAIDNIEDYLLDLPFEIRRSFVINSSKNKSVSKILGPSDVIFNSILSESDYTPLSDVPEPTQSIVRILKEQEAEKEILVSHNLPITQEFLDKYEALRIETYKIFHDNNPGFSITNHSKLSLIK